MYSPNYNNDYSGHITDKTLYNTADFKEAKITIADLKPMNVANEKKLNDSDFTSLLNKYKNDNNLFIQNNNENIKILNEKFNIFYSQLNEISHTNYINNIITEVAINSHHNYEHIRNIYTNSYDKNLYEFNLIKKKLLDEYILNNKFIIIENNIYYDSETRIKFKFDDLTNKFIILN